ncbi:MAG: putative sulfate exporter family transporter [Nitrospirae bacterium]|nr:putative sulfate exporter family transporter [Nitrospirota bacterium]
MEEKTKGISEDWLALLLGLFIFIVSLGVFGGVDLLGWGVSTKTWTDVGKSISPISKNYQTIKGEITKIDGQKLTLKLADGKEDTVTVKEDTTLLKTGDMYVKNGISGLFSLILTYLAMLILLCVGAYLMRIDIPRFILGFTVIFWLSYICWLCGSYAYIAATKNQLDTFKIPWALSLTGESGFIIALIVGLIMGNFFPGITDKLKEAIRPELYIKTAIVIMGAGLGVTAAESFTLASAVLFRGFCAIVEAYLIYWAIVYYIARKYFKFSPEWAAPLASGISICGVSAAIAVGGAIRARPMIPIMVSSLVVIFAVVEMLILPFAAQHWLWREPMVAGAWMGLAVKTDGGAVASGAITEALIRAKALDMEGIRYQEGWITMAATTVKMFIDVFIGIWAFVLAIIWCAKIECKEGDKVRVIEIWQRFPKFVIGYVVTFVLLVALCFPYTSAVAPLDKQTKDIKQDISMLEKNLVTASDEAVKADLNQKIKDDKDKIAVLDDQAKKPRKMIASAKLATGESNIFRVMFFVLTFFTIGMVSNFRKLWEEGIGKLAAVYVISLFGFIIWIGLFISWLFFHGVKPPIIAG